MTDLTPEQEAELSKIEAEDRERSKVNAISHCCASAYDKVQEAQEAARAAGDAEIEGLLERAFWLVQDAHRAANRKVDAVHAEQEARRERAAQEHDRKMAEVRSRMEALRHG